MNLNRLLQSTTLRTKMVWLLAPAVVGMLVLGIALMNTLLGEVRTARQEQAGLVPVRQLQQVVRLTQQHRGLSAAWLVGDSAAGSKRSTREQDVNQATQAFEALVRAGQAGEAAVTEWPALTQRWQALAGAVNGKSLNPKAAIAQHTALIEDELGLLDQILFDTQLILDPTADGYSLATLVGQQLPVLAERVGQLRGRGSAALASQSLPPQEAAMLVGLIAQAEAASRAAAVSLKHAQQYNPALQAVLRQPAENARREMTALVKLTQQALIESEALALAPGQYFAEATKAIDAQFALLGAATQALDDLLKARAQALQVRVVAVGAVLAALLLASVWLALAVARNLLRGFDHAVRVSEALAQGHLDVPITVEGRDETAQLMGAMARTQRALREIVRDVRQGVDSVGAASVQIANGNADLEARTLQQSASVARTASTMQQLTASVRLNADNASTANALATQANAAAARGGQMVQQVVGTMTQIQASSSRIADIIGTIDGIAFQTNILALNAAVEAARAGEQGRGFAVVASEVRSLAQRSATAAREIKQLIAESVQRVDTGSAAVREAGSTIEDMVQQVQQVAGLISQITQAGLQQSTGIAEVGQSLSALDDTTRQNSAMVEESAAAARSLQQQADLLTQRVSVFQFAEPA